MGFVLYTCTPSITLNLYKRGKVSHNVNNKKNEMFLIKKTTVPLIDNGPSFLMSNNEISNSLPRCNKLMSGLKFPLNFHS